MRYILAQGAQFKYQWELSVVLTNLYSLDPNADVVCLFLNFKGHPYDAVYDYIVRHYPKMEVHAYEDLRNDRNYVANIRPYLWYCYLTEDPAREQKTYFQIETDIIFRQLPDFTKMRVSATHWFGSDCGGYIDGKYLAQVTLGDQIIDNFARIIKVSRQTIEDMPGAGAHWLIAHPTAAYWQKVYQDCTLLYDYLEPLDSNIQKWTAEMWAQLYNLPLFGIDVSLSRELDFCRPTDPVEQFNKVNILHNAGVTGELTTSLFYKGEVRYNEVMPFNEDFSWVDKTKASIKYVEAVKKVVV